MIKTEQFAALAQEFQEKRHVIRKRYEADMESLEKFKGSGGYLSEVKARKERYAQDLENLKWQYKDSLLSIIDEMETAVNGRTYKAPSEDQLRLLQVLQMMEKPSHEEFTRMAESLKECPVAMMALQDIAKQKGSLHNYISGRVSEMPSEMAFDCIRWLRSGTIDFLDNDTKRSHRHVAQYYHDHYGTDIPLDARPMFDTVEGCFQEVGGMSAAEYDSFSAVVDF